MGGQDFYFPVGSEGAGTEPRFLPHLLVFLPGIMGSELVSDIGEPLWSLHPGPLWRALRSSERLLGGPLEDLEFHDSRVKAARPLMVPVPGLTRLMGNYHGLIRELGAAFGLTEDNYLEFAYDWRRPIAYTSVLLAEAIAPKLCDLRKFLPAAKVIILAHSMGGLVARHYLENGDAEGDCHRIITLGTPFRGAPKALDYLQNGFKLDKVPLRILHETMRSIPSVYELLPMYRVVVDQRDPVPVAARYVKDVTGSLSLDSAAVLRAHDLLQALNKSSRPEVTQPFLGFGPDTPQQAVMHPGGLSVTNGRDLLPAEYRRSGGDGTVPLISATPVSHRGMLSQRANQSHNGFVTVPRSIRQVIEALGDVLDDLDGEDPVSGLPGGDDGLELAPPDGAPVTALNPDDFYDVRHPVVLGGRAVNRPDGSQLWVRVTGVAPVLVVPDGDGSFTADLKLLEEGLHEVAVCEDEDGRMVLAGDTIEVG